MRINWIRKLSVKTQRIDKQLVTSVSVNLVTGTVKRCLNEYSEITKEFINQLPETY